LTAHLSLVDKDPALQEKSEEVKALIVKDNWETNLGDPLFPFTVSKVVQTMKRGEKCDVLIRRSYVKEKNPEFWAHI
jgi:hypothetical protein